MSKTRIRYKKTKDDTLKSVRDLHSESTKAIYEVFIDTKTCDYIIKNINSGRKYTGGDTVSNLHVLKRNVKKRLEKLGVSFGSEIRDNSSRISGVNCSYKRS